MHISDQQQSTSPILTKCSKMTEEGHRRHGMNGNANGIAVAAVKEEFPRNTSYAQGGRLKFFKDGKFILELERAREGERVSWVSVPRKTFWPPQGTAASTPTYRQESSTSLSVSDDNSSIQSSPWQRDHSWKQTSPRRNLSKQLAFYYRRAKWQTSPKTNKKRRRPYDPAPETNNSNKVLSVERTNKNSACNNTSRPKSRPSLLTIVQILLDKTISPSASSTAAAAAAAASRAETVVSPRKRILREIERDKVQVEDSCQKRSRNKAQVVVASANKIDNNSPVRVNGATTEELRTSSRSNSYSITSLLAEDHGPRRSPNNSPSHFPVIKHIKKENSADQYCSPPAEDRWYSESVDRLRSIELSHVDKRALSAFSHFPYMPPFIYPYPISAYYSPGSFMRSGYMAPPIYSTPPMTLPIRSEAPSCSWAMEPSRETEHRDDNITDMPLNLSKHAG